MLWSPTLPQNPFASLLPGKLPFMFYLTPAVQTFCSVWGFVSLVLGSAALPLPSSWSDYVDNNV